MSENEHIEISPEAIEDESRKRKVLEAFKEFGLSFEIEKYPDLVQRLADTREHFQDACEMARMIDSIKDKLELDSEAREKLLAATLLHDIGKSGPPHCKNDSPLREKIKKLFVHGYIPVFPDKFSDFVEMVGLENPEQIAVDLSTSDLPIDADMRPIDFLRRHVDWTYLILKETGLDEEIVKIAASHHILENKNPAQLSEEEISSSVQRLEITDKYHAYLYRILTFVDQYDAFKNRGTKPMIEPLTHDKIIELLRNKVQTVTHLSDEAKDKYLEIINQIFAESEKELDVRDKKV